MAEKTEIAAREGQRLSPREPSWAASPFRMLEQFAAEIDSIFDDFGVGRNWPQPRPGRNWMRTPQRLGTERWAPDVEVSQQNNELIVRTDLPGMKKDDICIDVTDTDLTISGERREEQKSERDGVYRSERTYGSFCRSIPLPEGAITDQAKATFKDGVLEVRMPAPPEPVTRGRRLEVKEGADGRK